LSNFLPDLKEFIQVKGIFALSAGVKLSRKTSWKVIIIIRILD
jgi:hypothetical protein